jgi:short subunit fatty acids transporter
VVIEARRIAQSRQCIRSTYNGFNFTNVSEMSNSCPALSSSQKHSVLLVRNRLLSGPCLGLEGRVMIFSGSETWQGLAGSTSRRSTTPTATTPEIRTLGDVRREVPRAMVMVRCYSIIIVVVDIVVCFFVESQEALSTKSRYLKRPPLGLLSGCL